MYDPLSGRPTIIKKRFNDILLTGMAFSSEDRKLPFRFHGWPCPLGSESMVFNSDHIS